MTYSDYLSKITETIKIRATNFRLSQNDIIYMTNNVFTEIASRVNFSPIRQEVIISPDTEDYDLDALFLVEDATIALDCYKITDGNDIVLSDFIVNTHSNVFQIKYSTAAFFHSYYDGETINFFRENIPDIEFLDSRIQMLLFEAIVNGIMYYTQAALPNPTASETPMHESSQYYRVYMKSIEGLIARFPQR